MCRVGSQLCALSIAHVDEVLRPLPVDGLAGMPSFVVGLSIIRGAPTPVVHAGELLGTTSAAPGRFVSIKVEGHRVVVAVDAVLGVRTLAAETLADMPALLSTARPELVAAIGTLDTMLLLILRAAHVLSETTWASVERELHG